jgi:hypothetical protein
MKSISSLCFRKSREKSTPLEKMIWTALAISISSAVAIAIAYTNASIAASIKTAVVYTAVYTSDYSLHWPWTLVNVTCFEHHQNGTSTITNNNLTAINLANPSPADLAFAITRLSQSAWAAAVAVCVVGAISYYFQSVSKSFRVVCITAVGVASFISLSGLFFVTSNLSEILESCPVPQN